MKDTEHPISLEIKNSQDLDIDFQKYWLSIKRRWLAAMSVSTAALVLTFAGVVVFLQKPSYVATGKLLVKPDEAPSLTGLGAETEAKLRPLTIQGNPVKTEIEIILSKPILRTAITSLDLKDDQGKPMSETFLKSQLEVKNVGGTDILSISYKNSNAEKAAALINKLMNAYIDNNKIVNRAEALAARQFIIKQLPETETSVRKAEEALRDFKQKNQVVALEKEAELAVEFVEKLKAQIAEVKAKLADVNAQSVMLVNQLGMDSEQAIVLAKLSQSPAVQTTLTALQKAEDELKIEKTHLQNENPKILNLEERVAVLKQQLQLRIKEGVGSLKSLPEKNLQAGGLEVELIKNLVNLKVEKFGLQNQINSLEAHLSSYRQRMNSLPKLKVQQRELERRVEAAQATYETLLKKLQEVQAAENQNIANARIVEKASVPIQSSLNKKVLFLAVGGLTISILLGAGTIFILEVRDSSLKTVKEAKNIFNYTLLAAVPSFKTFKQNIKQDKDSEVSTLKIPVLEAPDSPLSEVYRMLQANLEFLDSEKGPRVIAIASSVPQEGKSTVAVNLAVVLAELKNRVLLVDGDMRHPCQHHAWGLTNEVGLSNVIVGRVQLSQAIKQVMPNLDILTSGVTPPNPVTLLKSKGMASVIENCSENYDFVIIDAPPILLAADAQVLGKMTDGIIMVARPGVVDTSSAIATKELLKQSSQKVLGLVVNGVILENESDSYFHLRRNYYAGGSSITHNTKKHQSNKVTLS